MKNSKVLELLILAMILTVIAIIMSATYRMGYNVGRLETAAQKSEGKQIIVGLETNSEKNKTEQIKELRDNGFLMSYDNNKNIFNISIYLSDASAYDEESTE